MKTRLFLPKAQPLAEKIRDALASGCDRIEIAGSTRRRCLYVGDLEMVAIPRLIPDMPAQLSLLADEPAQLVSDLDILLDRLLRDKDNFRRGTKNGPLFKNFLIGIDEDGTEIGLDLFLTTPPQWGYILALRTGPGEFNQAWVTPQSKGGLLRDGYHFAGGWLHGPDGRRIPTPEEEDLFAYVGDGLLRTPRQRDNWREYYL